MAKGVNLTNFILIFLFVLRLFLLVMTYKRRCEKRVSPHI